jgi:hypothetical protein
VFLGLVSREALAGMGGKSASDVVGCMVCANVTLPFGGPYLMGTPVVLFPVDLDRKGVGLCAIAMEREFGVSTCIVEDLA